MENLFRYRKLVCTRVTRPFVVSSLSRYYKKIGAGRTEQHEVDRAE
jgi:hypothetical protein